MRRAFAFLAIVALAVAGAATWLLRERTAVDLFAPEPADVATGAAVESRAAERDKHDARDSAKGPSPATRVAADEPGSALQSAQRLPDTAIGGVVLDQHDRPVSGASVMVFPAVGCDATPESALATARSDAAGRFILPGLAPLTVHIVRASRPGFSPAVVDASPGCWTEIQLGGLGAIHGWVIDHGGGLAGVTVTARPKAGSPTAGSVARAVTDTGGHYRLADLPGGGAMRVTFAPAARKPVVLETGVRAGEEELLNVSLPPAMAVTGTVVDLETGAPISGATIGSDDVPLATIGPDGTFAVMLPRGQPTMLQARAPGYASADLYVNLDPGEPPLRIGLFRGATVDGFVVDTAGRPLAGTLVTVGAATVVPVAEAVARQSRERMPLQPGTQDGVPRQDANARTDERGHFVLAGIGMARGQAAVHVIARRAGYCEGQSEAIQLCLPQRVASTTVRLARAAILDGLVRGLVRGATPTVQVGSGSRFRSGVSVDAQGRFVARDLPPGKLWIEARAATRWARAEIEVVEGGRHRCQLDLVEPEALATPPGPVLRGRVVDASGRPAMGLSVYVESSRNFHEVTTRADGRFAVAAGAGPLAIEVREWTTGTSMMAEGLVRLTGVLPDREVEIVVPERGLLRLLVVDGENLPAPNVWLWWNGMRLQIEGWRDGVLTVRPPAGTGTLTVARDHVVIARLTDVRVVAGAAGPPVRLELPRLVRCALAFSEDHPLPAGVDLWLVHAEDVDRAEQKMPRWGDLYALQEGVRMMQLTSGALPAHMRAVPGIWVLRDRHRRVDLTPARLELTRDSDVPIRIDWHSR